MEMNAKYLFLFFCLFYTCNPSSACALQSSECNNEEMENELLSSEERYHEELIEEAKAKILEKLHLTEAPRTTMSPPLLQTLTFSEDSVDIQIHNNLPNRKAQRFALFSEIESRIYEIDDDLQQQKRIIFKFPADFSISEAEAVELWMFKTNYDDIMWAYQQVFDGDGNLKFTKNFTIPNQGQFSGWIRFEISSLLSNVSRQVGPVLGFEVADVNAGDSMISYGNEHEPFLLVFRKREELHRTERSLECSNDVAVCCREKLYISFSDVGWDSWIFAPKGYYANFCKGSCSNEFGLSRTHHTTIVMNLIKNNNTAAQSLGLRVSCVASRMSHISFIYFNENQRDIHVERNLTNMVVEECSCI